MSDFDNALLFKAVVDTGSLAAAARQLGINPSAASKRLSKLEASLTTQLLKRTTRKLSLTQAGQRFYERIAEIDHSWRSATDEAASYGREPKGLLRIAAPQPVISRFLLPRLTGFIQQYPSIELQVDHKPITDLPWAHADISISRELDNYDSATMVAKPFFQYHNALFAAPAYLRSKPAIDRLDDLNAHRCLAYSDTIGPLVWQLGNHKLAIQPALITNNTEALIAAAVAGQGIARLPPVIIEHELNQGLLLAVLPEYKSAELRTMAYFQKAEFMPQNLRLLLDYLATFASQS